MNNGDATTIAVLGGGLIKENGEWRTTLAECDAFGVLGDRLRVVAAALFYGELRQLKLGVKIWVTGGKGKLADISDAPTVASVIRRELCALNVPAIAIATEEIAGNTYRQLVALDRMIAGELLMRFALISNQYHLPRIGAMIEYAPLLTNVKRCVRNGKLALVAAEEILARHDELRDEVRELYESEEMGGLMSAEARGVSDIKAGLYKFN